MAALKPMDAFANPMPRRLGAHTFAAVAIRAGVPMRAVPEEYWCHATDLENHAQAVVDCHCGQLVIVELAELKPCSNCERWFLYAGPDLLALNSPSP